MVAEHRGLDLLGILDREDAMTGAQLATIADLTTGLGVERRVVEHHHPISPSASSLTGTPSL